jgi:hypothetical protein
MFTVYFNESFYGFFGLGVVFGLEASNEELLSLRLYPNEFVHPKFPPAPFGVGFKTFVGYGLQM